MPSIKKNVCKLPLRVTQQHVSVSYRQDFVTFTNSHKNSMIPSPPPLFFLLHPSFSLQLFLYNFPFPFLYVPLPSLFLLSFSVCLSVCPSHSLSHSLFVCLSLSLSLYFSLSLSIYISIYLSPGVFIKGGQCAGNVIIIFFFVILCPQGW